MPWQINALWSLSSSSHPQLSLPSQVPTPQRHGGRPSQGTPELAALPLCLFSSMGTACMLPVFSSCRPARLLSTCILLKKVIYPSAAGVPGVGQRCQKSEKGKASAWFRHRGCRRTVQVPSKLCLICPLHPFGSPSVVPRGAHHKPWDAGIAGGTFG